MLALFNTVASGVQPLADATRLSLSTWTLILGLVVLVILYKRHRQNDRPKNLPPGPRGWPIIGMLPTLAIGDPAKKLIEIGKTYGDIFSFSGWDRMMLWCSTILSWSRKRFRDLEIHSWIDQDKLCLNYSHMDEVGLLYVTRLRQLCNQFRIDAPGCMQSFTWYFLKVKQT